MVTRFSISDHDLCYESSTELCQTRTLYYSLSLLILYFLMHKRMLALSAVMRYIRLWWI